MRITTRQLSDMATSAGLLIRRDKGLFYIHSSTVRVIHTALSLPLAVAYIQGYKAGKEPFSIERELSLSDM